MSIITDVYAREVLDSRGNPTLEVEVYTESGAHDEVAHENEGFIPTVTTSRYGLTVKTPIWNWTKQYR